MFKETYGGATLLSVIIFNLKTQALVLFGLLAFDLKIDAPTATVMVAALVAASSMWQSWMLSRVHTLVNSNFTEAKAARTAAEAALKTSQDLVANLQQQLDRRGVAPAALAEAVAENTRLTKDVLTKVTEHP